jgi:Lrp/AsnC family transcriptional regulator
LQRDATASTASIAEQVNVSQSPCWRRINRLEQEGLIKGRVALLDREALGMEVVVFATVNLTSTGRQNLLEFEREIVRYPEVVECYTMTGIWDYMLKIVTLDIRHYEVFVRNTLTASPSVRELHSHMAVTEIKNVTELPLDTQL